MNNDTNVLAVNRNLLSCLLAGAVAWGMACASDNNGFVLPDGAVSTSGGTVGSAGAGGTGPVGGSGARDAGLPGVDAPSAATCQSDLQCTPLGLLCDTKRQRCAQCINNLQCKTDERCAAGSCEKVNKCVNSLDCAGVPGGQTICDESFGECVACAKAADCAMNQDCLGRKCVTYTPCKNSLDCPQGTVCETQIGRCYQCTRDADCGMGRVCAGNTCRPECASDNQCTSMGLLCNAAGGFCAECLKDEDCPDEQHCGAGQCKPDVCLPGSSSCAGAAAQTCNAAGSGFDPPRPCAARQSCVASGGVASCKNWACTADTVECVDRSVVTCSKDGLRIIANVDCSLNGQYCSNAACSDRVCTPGARHCYMDDVYTCDGTGLIRTAFQNCNDTTQYCDPQAVAVCAQRVCTPGAPACNGNTATTCNGNGSGYVAGGTNCAGQICSAGVCVNAAIDNIVPAGATVVSYSSLYGNKYLASANRTLIKAEIYIQVTTSRSLDWAVFESTTETGTYTRIWTKNEVVAGAAAAAYYSSGDISVPMVAGRYYVIGVDASIAMNFYYETTAALPLAISFGSALGYEDGLATSATYAFGATGTGVLFRQRLTTAP